MRRINIRSNAIAFFLLCLVWGSCASAEVRLASTPYGEEALSTLKLRKLRLLSEERRKPTDKRIQGQLLSTLEDIVLYSCAIRTASMGWKFLDARTPESDSDNCSKAIKDLQTSSPNNFILNECIGTKKEIRCEQFLQTQMTIDTSEAQIVLNKASKKSKRQQPFRSLSINSTRSPRIAELETQLYRTAGYRNKTGDAQEEEKKNKELLQTRYQIAEHYCALQPMVFYRNPEELGTSVEKFDPSGDPELSKLKGLIKDYQVSIKEESPKKQKSPFSFSTSKAKRQSQDRKNYGSEPFTNPEKLSDKTKNSKNLVKEDLKTGSIRIRVIPAQCMKQIKELLDAEPLSPRALCMRDGLFHPICTQAKQRPNKKHLTVNEKKETPKKATPKLENSPLSDYSF